MTGLRWQFLELPPASDDITQEPATAPAGATASMLADQDGALHADDIAREIISDHSR